MEARVTTRKKTLLIWDYFTIAEDDKFAKCTACELPMSRGRKTAKIFGTTNLLVHLKAKHSELYTEFEKKAKELKETKARENSAESQSPCQLSLMQCED